MSNFGIPPLLSLFIHSIQNFITDFKKKKISSCSSGRHLQKLETDCSRGTVLTSFQMYRLSKVGPKIHLNAMFKGSCG